MLSETYNLDFNLYSQTEFNKWLEGCQKSGKSYDEITSGLMELESAIGYFRAGIVASRRLPIPVDDVSMWLERAYELGDGMLRIMVLSAKMGVDANVSVANVRPESNTTAKSIVLLNQLLNEIENFGPHEMRLEAEMRVYQALIKSHLSLNQYKSAEYLVLRLLKIAEIFKDEGIKRTFLILHSAIISAGNEWSRSVDTLLHDDLVIEGVNPRHIRSAAVNLSNGLLNLGALTKASHYVNVAISLVENDMPLFSQKTWIDALRGFLNQKASRDHVVAELYSWQIESMRLLSLSQSSAPIGKFLSERSDYLGLVFEKSTVATQKDLPESDQLFGIWMRGKARIELSEYGMAFQEFVGVGEIATEDLLNRVLCAALDLDLAMTPLDTPRVPLHQAENVFRAVFADAKKIPHADPEGLAALVMRWHPQVAVYAALMPHPVRECLPALDLLARVDQRATWRGQALPPALVPHLTRLGVRVPTLGVTLGGNAAYQVARLSRLVGEATVWGPVVPLLPVVVALSRGGEAHREAARRAWQDFGVLPKGAHRDPELEGVVEVWRAVVAGERQLADGLRALQDL